MSEGLKNCPFCGGEPEITQAIENDPTSLVATCPDDDCVGSTIRCSIDLWNTRATPTIEPIDGLEEAIDILEVHMADMGDMAVVLVAARAYLKLMEQK